MAAEIAVETRQIYKNFDQIQAVSNFNLTVFAGEMFGLVGPDGAGKTTLLKLLCGIIKPTSGQVKIFGLDAVKEREKIKRWTGYLSQKLSFYEDLTVEENIEFFAGIHNEKDFKPRREELLSAIRLEPFRKKLARHLSGGMRQKLALACTLIHRPRLIFLDEPTTGVDAISRRELWKILSDLLRQGITILLTTPYMDEAERCSRIGLMFEGSLLASGTLEDIRPMMRGQVAEIVTSQNRQAFKLLRQMDRIRGAALYGDYVHIVIDQPEKDLAAVEEFLTSHGLAIEKLNLRPASLENIFISLAESSAGIEGNEKGNV